MKRIILSSVLATNLAFAGFLMDSVKDIVNVENITNLGNNAGLDILGEALNNPQLGAAWESIGGGYASGTMEMCYDFALPTANTNVNTDICAAFTNDSVDVCGALPQTIGYYTKKSSTLNMALNSWCNDIGASQKGTIEEASKKLGTSGKTKEEVAGSKFGSEEKSKDELNRNDAIKKLDSQSNIDKGSYAQKANDLTKSGNSLVLYNEISRLAKNTEELDPSKLTELGDEILFKDINEYYSDLNYNTSSVAVATNTLFNMDIHAKVAAEGFKTLNNIGEDYTQKAAFVENFIENKDTGIRTQYKKWAEIKAAKEIENTIDSKVESVHVFFDKNTLLRNFKGNPNLDEKSKIAIINNNIRKQQYQEQLIMLKWNDYADNKADNLKRYITKQMYASQVFDRASAEAEISNIISN